MGYRFDLSAACFEPGDQADIAHAILLHSDRVVDDGQLGVERREDLSPGVRCGDLQRWLDA